MRLQPGRRTVTAWEMGGYGRMTRVHGPTAGIQPGHSGKGACSTAAFFGYCLVTGALGDEVRVGVRDGQVNQIVGQP